MIGSNKQVLNYNTEITQISTNWWIRCPHRWLMSLTIKSWSIWNEESCSCYCFDLSWHTPFSQMSSLGRWNQVSQIIKHIEKHVWHFPTALQREGGPQSVTTGNLVFSTKAEQWWDENPTLLDPLTPSMLQFWGLFLAVSWPLFTLPPHYYTITTSPNAHFNLGLPTNLWLSKFLLIVYYPIWNVPFLERQKGWQSVPSKYYKT